MQWLNSLPVDGIDIANRGLAYGDGVFETILCHYGKSAMWRSHQARLQNGLNVLGITQPDLGWLSKVFEAAQAHPYAVVKLIVTRSGSATGYKTSKNTADVYAQLKPMVESPFIDYGLSVGISETPLVNDPRLAGVKHLNRLSQVLASQEAARKGFDELLLVDSDGFVVEAISSNVFFLCGDHWVTPHLPFAGVAGVMRENVLDLNNKLLPGCSRVSMSVSQLDQCRAAFLCNAVRGIMPIASINDTVLDIGLCAPIIERVKQHLHA